MSRRIKAGGGTAVLAAILLGTSCGGLSSPRGASVGRGGRAPPPRRLHLMRHLPRVNARLWISGTTSALPRVMRLGVTRLYRR